MEANATQQGDHVKATTTEPGGFALEAATLTELRVQANGSADFGGTVSSSEFTAPQITQGDSTGNSIELATRALFGTTSSSPAISMRQGGTFVGRMQGRDSELHISHKPALADASFIDIKGSTDIVLDAGGDVSMRPTGFTAFEGDNLSTSATTGLGPDLYLTVNTTAGLRKLPLYQT